MRCARISARSCPATVRDAVRDAGSLDGCSPFPAADFKLLSCEDSTTEFQFNKRAIHHPFCSTYGLQSFAGEIGPGGEVVALNVRCFDGIDLDLLAMKNFDSRSR